LKLSFLTSQIWVQVEFPNCPISLVFQLNQKVTSLPINWFKRSHSDGSLVCRPIGPKSIIKLNWPIFSRSWYSFLKNSLNLPIWNLNLATCLGVIGVASLCLTPNLCKSFSKCLEMKWDPSSLITTLGTPNLGKIIFLNSFMTTYASLMGEAMALIYLDT